MNKKIKKGVIPAAGSAQRLGYLSHLLPKTLFPIYDRPIFHHLINQMESLGIEDIYVIVNIHKEKIIEYYKSIKSDLRSRIHFIEQKKLNGLANAILLAERHIKDEPFLTILGDECIITESLKPAIDFYYKNDTTVTEIVIKEEDIELLKQTCSANIEKNGKIIEILEKPENPPYMVRGCGIYIFKPEIFDYIRTTPINSNRGEKEITNTINILAKLGKAYGYFIDGESININDPDELLKASQLFRKFSPNNVPKT
jgi:dTDP-glucose pyrophosphorylase